MADATTLATIGSGAVGIGGFLYGIVQGFNARKAQDKTEASAEHISNSKAHEERADQLANILDDTKKRWDQEHKEYMTYRDYVHEKAKGDQANLSALQLQLVELQSRPDLSDVLRIVNAQSDINARTLASIQELIGSFKHLAENIQLLINRISISLPGSVETKQS